MKRRFWFIVIVGFALGTLVTIIPDAVLQQTRAQSSTDAGRTYEDLLRQRFNNSRSLEQEQLYSIQNSTTENRERIAELQRRVALIEAEKTGLDIAFLKGQVVELDARLDTVFELGRVVLGAAILYIIQMAGNAIIWVSSKTKK